MSVSSKYMTPELRLINFKCWVKKSLEKFGPKFKNLLDGKISIEQIKLFSNRSERLKIIYEEMTNNKKSEISFAELFFNSKEDMLIPCPENNHGLVCMTPYMHTISITGCTKCSGKYRRTQEEFDLELKITFNETVERIDLYISQKIRMRMKCIKHGEFPCLKSGSDLLNGHQGCPICQIEQSSENRKWKPDEWIEKSKEVHPDNKDDYLKIRLEIEENILFVYDIRCILHNKYYKQRANDHHNGHRCKDCKSDTLSNIHRIPYNKLIERCKEKHKDEKYSYDEKEPEDYKNGNSKIQVECHNIYKDGKKHGIWNPSAHNHINGSKCRKCSKNGYSKIGIEWITFLSSRLSISINHAENGNEYKIPQSRYTADGYSLDYNCIFEFNGCHVHGCKICYINRNDFDQYGKRTHEDNYKRTEIKEKFCLDNGFKYIKIWYCEWIKIKDNKDLLDNYIVSIKNEIQLFFSLI